MEKSRLPLQMDSPANQGQVYRVLLHHNSVCFWEIEKDPRQTILASPLIEAKCTELYYTKTVLPMEKWRHIQGRWTHLIEHKPTTPKQYYLWRNWDISMADRPPNWAQVYRALLHQDSISYWEIVTYRGQTDPPANRGQVYKALLYQSSITYGEIETYPEQTDPPANWAEVYRTLLHQSSITYG